MTVLRVPLALSALLYALAAAADTTTPTTKPEVPFVPTPEAVVDKMLELGKVDKKDVLYDLGSGDGRIVITAAKRFGTHGMGVDIDPQRIKEAKENAKEAGVTDLVSFKQGDLFKTDFSKATVVTLYLLPDVNLRLRPKLLEELKPGTRVVSHNYHMGDWKPEQTVTVTSSGNRQHTVYVWTVPERGAAGRGDAEEKSMQGKPQKN